MGGMNRYNLDQSALLIVDVQKDFCPGGALAVSRGDNIIPVINRIAPDFPVVVATRDWHPAGHISFASSHPGKSVYDTVEADGLEQVLWPDHCVQGTDGAGFHDSLDIGPVSMILHKGCSPSLDSYSAFFDNGKRAATGLEGYLKGLGINTVYICGLATDYCVFFSAMDAARAGFETFVISNAVKAVNVPAGSEAAAVGRMEKAGIGMVTL